MAPSEIYLANFPYGTGVGRKLRPVLLLTGPLGQVPEFLAAYISSVAPSPLLQTDIVIDPADPQYATTNLKTLSVLRLHKLATIHKPALVRQLGMISPPTAVDVDNRLRDMLRL